MGSGVDQEAKDTNAITEVGHLKGIRYSLLAISVGSPSGMGLQ
jgi:hypothetical protein